MRSAAITPVGRKQIHQQGLIETELAKQHVRAGHSEHLCRAQTFKHIRNILTDTKAINGGSAVLPEHLLGKHQVSEIQLPDFVVHTGGAHDCLLLANSLLYAANSAVYRQAPPSATFG
jgi:hypothetical protein